MTQLPYAFVRDCSGPFYNDLTNDEKDFVIQARTRALEPRIPGSMDSPLDERFARRHAKQVDTAVEESSDTKKRKK